MRAAMSDLFNTIVHNHDSLKSDGSGRPMVPPSKNVQAICSAASCRKDYPMKKLSANLFAHIENWILRHARPLEAARYAFHFQNGRSESFLALLAQYQNRDGGFGHALEPDNWDPHSTPYTTMKAAELLASIGFTDHTHPLYQGALRYFRSGDGFTADGGWQFSMPTSNDYPHAPWWTYSETENVAENLGLSAHIAAFIFNTCQSDDSLYAKAEVIARRALNALMTDNLSGEMGVSGCALLMPYWMKTEAPAFLPAIAQKMTQTSNAVIVREPARWHTHVPRPSAAILSPESPMYKGNEEAIYLELDWLIDTLPQDDLWPIDWSWFQNNAQYPAEFAISEMWWKAWLAIDKLLLLRNFDRLP